MQLKSLGITLELPLGPDRGLGIIFYVVLLFLAHCSLPFDPCSSLLAFDICSRSLPLLLPLALGSCFLFIALGSCFWLLASCSLLLVYAVR